MLLEGDLRDYPGTASNSFLARPTLPDAYGMSLHRGLAAKCAGVSRMLGNLHFFDLLSEGSTISLTHVISFNDREDLVDRCWRETTRWSYLVPYFPVTPTSKLCGQNLSCLRSFVRGLILTLRALRHLNNGRWLMKDG